MISAVVAGCVSIHDTSFQVSAPSQADPYQRNVLDKCTPHINPHRLVIAQVDMSSPFVTNGSQTAYNQVDFDKLWNSITPLDTSRTPLNSLTQEPLINWDKEQAFFLLVPVDNTCQKTIPYGEEMVTDCYNMDILLYRYNEGQNCGAPGYYPVYIYIYAKSTLPVTVQWTLPTPTPTFTALPTDTPTPTATPHTGGKKGK